MKIALLADIHTNLEALEKVLLDARSQQVTSYVCLGDIVGYNANPKECLDLIRELNMPVVKGNWDEYCTSPVSLEGFDINAAESVRWTRTQLNEADRLWLNDLPYVRQTDQFTIVHGTLERPERWGYIFSDHWSEAEGSFNCQTTNLCFNGHTHIPVAFARDASGTMFSDSYTKFKLDSHKRYCINVGSVGQPRDGIPKAAYVIYNLEEQTIELRRVAYDVTRAQMKILAAGLPARLAEHLGLGQ